MQDVGDVSEVADVIKFLLTDESRYVTGQIIYIDGGLSLTFMMHIDVCYGLIYDKKADTVLVVQNEHGGWSFPGGAKESSETLAQALLREIKEETDLDVEIVGEIETFERYSPTHDIFHLFYVILKDEKAYGAPISHRDDEIMMVQWIAFDDVRIYLPWYKNGISHLKDKIITR